MLHLFKALLLLGAFCIGTVFPAAENECLFQDNCEGCLTSNLKCAWCTDRLYEFRYRCLTRDQLLQHGCYEDSIYENEPHTDILEDTPVKDYESVGDRAVQVQPQRLHIKLVKTQSERIKFTYRPAKNNALDLYILMDLTWTMRDDKETLTELGAELAAALRTLTPNYRLGFGSYADKPTMPMIMTNLRENPCAPEHETCEPTYGFRHHLALSDDTSAFVHSVNQSRITGNLDNLEGGFDALMQVLVCTREIGWKQEARKIVILVTDGFMHLAGDGLLAGITQRNDKQCHLSADGEYLGSLEYDYPSLEEIYRELLKRKVNVIFAVTESVVGSYHQLSNLMKEISNVEILSADSSNILELIKKSYQTLIKRAQFTDNSPSFIKLDYETDCGGQFSSMRQRSYCNDVEMGKEVDFYLNITLTDFPTDGVYTHKIRVEESSLSEYMEIEVEIQRPCPCFEKAEPEDEYGREQCYTHGYMRCGMCQCEKGWAGALCNCPIDTTNATMHEANLLMENLCRKPSESAAELGPVCSYRGECECGQCTCMSGYSGKYCECLECEDCDPQRAECHCGECVCKPGWSGKHCNCNESADSCIGPKGNICFQRGACKCGECICDEPYKGRFCEVGSETENKLCTFYELCVACLIKQKLGMGVCENLTDICSSAEANERFTYAFASEEINADIRCLVRIENKFGIKCDHYFSYRSAGKSENYLLIQVSNCEPVNYYALVGTISLATIILGLLVICLIWVCVRLKDAAEYARFDESRRNGVLMESPIYKDPITRYQVPAVINDEKQNPFE